MALSRKEAVWNFKSAVCVLCVCCVCVCGRGPHQGSFSGSNLSPPLVLQSSFFLPRQGRGCHTPALVSVCHCHNWCCSQSTVPMCSKLHVLQRREGGGEGPVRWLQQCLSKFFPQIKVLVSNSLGQLCVLQGSDSSLSPTHGSPPYCSGTFSLVLNCCPPPHSLLHLPQLVQGSQIQ